jgi:hypothetical protein
LQRPHSLPHTLIANEAAYLNYHPTVETLREFQSRLQAQGVTKSIDQLRAVLDPSLAKRKQFMALVESQGLYKTELVMVKSFEKSQLQFATQVSGHQFPRATLRTVASANEYYWACLIAAVVGISTGCTITAFACEAAVLACLGCSAMC